MMELRRTTERTKHRGALFATLAAILCTTSWSQVDDPVYDEVAFDKIEGVPSDSIDALALDEAGYLWIGTQGGLARFDGTRFALFPSAYTDGLEADRITALHHDTTGTLWIGAETGPLARMRGGRFEQVPGATALEAVRQIFEAADGTIWIAGSALGRWRENRMEIVCEPTDPSRAMFRRLAEDGGTIWAVGPDGLKRVVGDRVEVVDPRPAGGLFRGLSGELWVGLETRRAYRVLDPERVEIEIPFAFVYDEIEVDHDRRSMATDVGIVQLEPSVVEGRPFDASSVKDDNRGVRAMLGMPDDSVWLGCDRGGLRYLTQRHFTRIALPTAGPEEAVLEIHRLDETTALVGSFDWQESWIFSLTGAHVLLESEPPDLARVRDVTEYVDGVAWAATMGGLARLEGHELSPVAGFEDQATSIVRASDDSVWVEQRSRFVEVLPDGSRGRSTPPLDAPISRATADDGGFLCISGDRVVHVDTETATVRIQFDPPGVEPRDILADGFGATWVTTYGGGLHRLRRGGQVDSWTARDGLPDDFLGWIDIARDEDGVERVWLNTNRGLACVDLEALESHDANDDDGVPSLLLETGESNGPGGASLTGGLILVPTLHGLIMVNSRAMLDSRAPPRVALQWTEIDGERDMGLARPRGSADLAFGYTAIYFPRSLGARFQYRLDGYDDTWIDGGHERVARYTNIPPGDYTFRVRARSGGSAWSEAVTATPIAVAPRWFQRRALQILFALGIAISLAFLIGLRTRALMRRGDILAREVERRKLVEEQLRASEENYVSVLDSAHDGIVMIEANGTIDLANAAMTRMFGYPNEELVGRSATWLGLPDLAEWSGGDDDDDSGIIAMREVRETWKTRNLVIARADGTPVDVELSVAEETFRGRPRLVGIVRDVTERRQMTDRLRESEQRFRQLFRTAPTAIVAWQPDRTIVDWNERASELFGWGGEAERTIDGLLEMDGTGDPMREALLAVVNDRRSSTLVHPTRTRAGEGRRCRWTFAPLMGADGEVHTVISLVTDVTDEERVQHDMESLRRKLARAEETERSRIARELHDDLSQRLAALAIEMQILENGIEERPLEDLRRAIRAVQSGLDRVSTDVHALSRQLHPTVLDDLGLSRALRSECLRRERASKVTIRFVDESDRIDIRDEVGLSLFRIAQESVQNAIKHSQAHEIVVRLAATREEITLTIVDDGVGFDASRISDNSGGGLGLASVRERARLIGADLQLVTMPGDGASISVRVQRHTEPRASVLVSRSES